MPWTLARNALSFLTQENNARSAAYYCNHIIKGSHL